MENLLGANATGLSYDIHLPAWVTPDWVRFGVLPFVITNISFWVTVLCMELVVKYNLMTQIECTSPIP